MPGTGNLCGSFSCVSPYYNYPMEQVIKQKQKGKGMLEHVKEYVSKYKDVLFTLVLIIVVDHFVFNGALKNKIQEAIEGIIHKTKNIDIKA